MARFDALPYIVQDGNGDTVSGGSVEFYQAGTTTPVTVYSDSALSVSQGTSVATNANGQLIDSASQQTDIYVAAGDYKIIVKDADGATLATYDNMIVRADPLDIADGGTAATSASAARTSLGLAIGSDVQAYDADTAKTDVAETITGAWDFTGGFQIDGQDPIPLLPFDVTYGGTADVITLTTGFGLSALTTGQRFRFLATANNTGATTINVDGTGALTAKTITGAALPADYIRTDAYTECWYDGTDIICDRAIEYINNSGNRAVLYADGTMRCWKTNVSTLNFSGGTRSTDIYSWAPVVAFAGDYVGQASADDRKHTAGVYRDSLSVMTGYAMSVNAFTGTTVVSVSAIGPWYV